MKETIVIDTGTAKGRFLKDFLRRLDECEKEDLVKIIYVLKRFPMEDFITLYKALKEKKEETDYYICSGCNGKVEGEPEICPHCGAKFD